MFNVCCDPTMNLVPQLGYQLLKKPHSHRAVLMFSGSSERYKRKSMCDAHLQEVAEGINLQMTSHRGHRSDTSVWERPYFKSLGWFGLFCLDQNN